jgi:threonine/homoserine/homoserine lactone efflux protein
MPSASMLLAFVAATLVLIAIPGPASVFLFTRAVVHGRREALRSALGIETATVVLAAAVAVGLSGILASSRAAFAAVHWAGAAYLAWLGVRAWRDRNRTLAGAVSGDGAASFRRGFLVGIANPKVALFLTAFLPQFIDPSEPKAPQLLLLGMLFATLGLAADALNATIAGALGQHALQRVRSVRVGLVAAPIYFALAAWAALTGARPARTR